MLVIGRLHVGAIQPEWLMAWEELRKPARPDGTPDWITFSAVRQVVHSARNDIARFTLEQYPDATHLFFLDDDITLPPDGLTRLLQDSIQHDLPIVTGLYIQRGEPHLPVVYRRRADGHHVQLTAFCPGLQQVDACGAGCLLIRADVLRAIAATGEAPFDYSEQIQMSEDLAFCARAAALGFPVVLDFDVRCGHLATVSVTYEAFAQIKARGITYADDEVARLSQEVRPWPPAPPVVAPASRATRRRRRQSVPVEAAP